MGWAASFNDACVAGDLGTLKALAARFNLTATDPSPLGSLGLRIACANGHLEVARWLVEYFDLTAAHARAGDNYALRRACAYGFSEVAHWLVERFGLTADDARAHGNEALREACYCGHRKIVELLMDLYAEEAWPCALRAEDFLGETRKAICEYLASKRQRALALSTGLHPRCGRKSPLQFASSLTCMMIAGACDSRLC